MNQMRMSTINVFSLMIESNLFENITRIQINEEIINQKEQLLMPKPGKELEFRLQEIFSNSK